MELILNLAWVLLALPAFFLWRGHKSSRQVSSCQCLLALACMLVILFPVISASDDLLAMRAEMEESPVSKRSLRQADRTTGSNASWQTSALASPTVSFVMNPALSWLQRSIPRCPLPAAPVVAPTGRAPPVLVLS